MFPCPRVSCPAVFYNASSLGSHVNSIHKEEPEESTCAICGDYSEGVGVYNLFLSVNHNKSYVLKVDIMASRHVKLARDFSRGSSSINLSTLVARVVTVISLNWNV